MKKHILLAVGVAALVLAAKEYGINSLDDLKRVLKPYLGVLDMNELSGMFENDNDMGSQSGSQRMSNVTHES